MAKKTDESAKFNQIGDRLCQENESLKIKLEQCDRLFNLSMDMLAMMASDGRFIHFNAKWTNELGYSHEELSGKSCLDYVHPDDKKKMIEQFGFVLTGSNRTSDFDVRFQAKDGSYQWLFWHTAGRVQEDCVYAVVREMTQSKNKAEEQEAASHSDPLTGLYNRTGFLSHATGYLKFAARKKTELLLFLVHMGGLKKINDVFGYQETQWTLIKAAEVLRTTFRESDIMARLGAHKFAILALDAWKGSADILKKRMIEGIGLFNEAENPAYAITLDFGVACFNPESPVSLDQLLAQAEYELRQGV